MDGIFGVRERGIMGSWMGVWWGILEMGKFLRGVDLEWGEGICYFVLVRDVK